MIIRPSTKPVLVNGESELAIVIEADVNEKTPVKKFVSTLIKDFVNQKMISAPEISVLAIRINGDMDLNECVKEWKRELLANKPMSQAANAFINNVIQAIDAIHYPTKGDPIRFEL